MIDETLTRPNGRVLKNRIVKSAMSEALAGVQSNPTQSQIDLFQRWSAGGGRRADHR